MSPSQPLRRPSLLAWSRAALSPLGHKPAAHHRLLIAELSRLSAGDHDRLMVLMPPGSAKSTYASVLFPAWWFTRHPSSAVIAASHTASLAVHFGRRVRAQVAERGQLLGYGLASGHRAAGSWSTTTGGEYFATGVRGPVTGRRADLVVVDDPLKSHAEADSALLRDHLWDWYRTDLCTRLKPRGRIALVMTRWHQDDLAGRLLDSGDDWHVVRLPALAEDNDPLGREAGAPLWPDYEDAATLARRRLAVGARAWSALYQQHPAPDAGALFRVHALTTYDAAPADVAWVRAWDLAATAAAEARDPDWTVGVKLGRDPVGRFVIADVVRLRGGPREVEQAIVATASLDGRAVPIGLPQDPGQAGKQQVAWLAGRLAGHRVMSSPETGAKLTRAAPFAAQVDAGNVAIVSAGWNRALIDELRDFPTGRKDDQVDALSRAFAMLADAPPTARRLNLDFVGR